MTTNTSHKKVHQNHRDMEDHRDMDQPVRTLTFMDVMDDIEDTLSEADGEHVAKVHNDICSNKIAYSDDSVWTEQAEVTAKTPCEGVEPEDADGTR